MRFGGDAGDGIHLAGDQLTRTAMEIGNAVFTLADYAAEIRSPPGSLSGVAGFQVHFGETARTPGDRVQALVVMNPAALRVYLADVEPNGIVIVNSDAFTPDERAKAGYVRDPLLDGTLAGYRLIAVPMSKLIREALAGLKVTPRETDRCRSFFALGLVFWLYDRPLDPTLEWLRDRLPNQPDIYKAGKRSLQAGYHHGESLKIDDAPYSVPATAFGPGVYRRVTGADALALGLTAAAARTGRELFFAGFPEPPASELLHWFLEKRPPGVCAAQAEDPSAAAAMALGAAFGGALGVTATAGPGLGDVSQIIGLGVSAELPMVVVHTQRAGPSLGLPGRPEQSDLLQAFFGRNGDCPIPVLAVRSPADGFNAMLEATQLATRYMVPVVVLTDVYLMQAAEAWAIPSVDDLPNLRLTVTPPPSPGPRKSFLPYARDVRLARPWALPGTPGLEHRIGGLEKEDGTGVVSYEAADHEHMTHVRMQKVSQIAGDIPPLHVDGPARGDLLIVGWGSTAGAIHDAATALRKKKMSVASAHFGTLNPLPANTGDVLRRYTRVVCAELNAGHLRQVLRSQFLLNIEALTKIQGKPMWAGDVEDWVLGEFNRPQPPAEGWFE
ncbi:MAG: 2-oxoacid:acceptor oxidoreductase subunit alpha [Gemmataceae bacterium]